MLKANVAGSRVLSQINWRWEFRPHRTLARPRVGNIAACASASSSADNHTQPMRLLGGLNGKACDTPLLVSGWEPAASPGQLLFCLIAPPSPATSQMRLPFPTRSPPDLPAPRAALAKSPSLTRALQTWQRFSYKETTVSCYRSSREVQTGERWQVGSALCSASRRPRRAVHLAEVPPSPQFGLKDHLWAKTMERREQLQGLRALTVIKISTEAHDQVPLTSRVCA